MFKIRFYIGLLLWTLTGHLVAQSSNDHMVAAIKLKLNEPIKSKTDGNTVEYSCIDESFTGKCIKYHNDQWFTFETDTLTHLFININGQLCRDLLGIQLVVFEGELCNPETYQITDCVSLATQDDIYIELENLSPQQKYWLNVDGYLHDFCRFSLEVSTTPKGLSVNNIDMLKNLSVKANKNHFKINWEVKDSLASINSFIITRRQETSFKSEEINEQPFIMNAYGVFQTQYLYIDTVYVPGNYYYQIVAKNQNGQKSLIGETEFHLAETLLSKVQLQLDYELNARLRLKLINQKNNQLLDVFEFYFDPRQHTNYPVYIEKYKDFGVKKIRIEVIDLRESHVKTYFVDL